MKLFVCFWPSSLDFPTFENITLNKRIINAIKKYLYFYMPNVIRIEKVIKNEKNFLAIFSANLPFFHMGLRISRFRMIWEFRMRTTKFRMRKTKFVNPYWAIFGNFKNAIEGTQRRLFEFCFRHRSQRKKLLRQEFLHDFAPHFSDIHTYILTYIALFSL